MRETITMIRMGEPVAPELANLAETLLASGFASVDYAELRDAGTLERLERDNGNARLFVAARMGATRLIDNMAVSPAP